MTARSTLCTALFALAATVSSQAQERRQLVNHSGQPWTIAMVEGVKARMGTLTIIDKATGKTLSVLSKVGDSTVIPAQSCMLVVFNRVAGYMYCNFLLKDIKGYFAEYVATVEYLSDSRLSIDMVDTHVGPPMDLNDDSDIKQFVSQGIEFRSQSIIIHWNTLIPLPKVPPNNLMDLVKAMG